MEKILISSCFLGHKVRYDGGDNLLVNATLKRWQAAERLVVICPELAGGLSTPRPPAEIQLSNENIIVKTNSGEDVTPAFELGAQRALSLCHAHGVRYALLKESSPSCGSSSIYNGEFSQHKVPGQGITTALLRANGIKVFSEKNLLSLIAELS
ncbi:DUF523 domain-containing protein [Colwellia sp. M166]|jgi:uncharacterized protein YbbK (DUF523 family)|uniref:DUF523 domain-containing protein n=1 Tax=Colwellia sp. M166 TaxID=2583805 RepID=UPI00211E5CA8|nr:DUF523 domain-containing protein [Colwellia sp. M166]UUO23654.1 DUF523 domain-containing protein [Colwellia sp. M166]|tara:strand:- start:65902 stop:66363 length:462 start_codon:yes stop_codon:yes gene_type:complete